ncbi:MAG TPA: hypothetical protein VEC38_03640 [Candidatus Binataceae bacterium]|nr:hypothetical protein [Candidatus Binataceae bacterium]
MVELSIRGDDLHLEVLGWSKFFALKSSIDIPRTSIKDARVGRHLPARRWTDLRALGTGFPGIISAGTFWMGSPRQWVFVDLTRWSKEVITLFTEGQRYSVICIEVKDAADALNTIRSFAGLSSQAG